jgi:hypothetical protein
LPHPERHSARAAALFPEKGHATLQLFPNNQRWNVSLAMRNGYNLNQAFRRPIEDQVISNRPEEDRTILGPPIPGVSAKVRI